MLPAFWVMSIGQMSVGLLGMRRRVADYDPALGITPTHVLITLSALIIGWSVLIMIYNFASSARRVPAAEQNPWRSRSPEWQIASPAPEFNYDVPFEVVGNPYDYGLDDWTYTRDVAPAPSGD
jgi:cytochrome c oxidase subunit 1